MPLAGGGSAGRLPEALDTLLSHSIYRVPAVFQAVHWPILNEGRGH